MIFRVISLAFVLIGQLLHSATALSAFSQQGSATNLFLRNPFAREPPKRKIAILLCPAQFCVPEDYKDLWQILRLEFEKSGLPIELAGSSQVVQLSRWDWIKVARQLPTLDFVRATLPVRPTLYWYFEAIEEAMSEIVAKDPDAQIAVVGHSIGGWVARAALGGMSQTDSATFRLSLQKTATLLTLGTPHVSPEDALVDQTRGLLNAIEETASCSPQSLLENEGISFTCVVSKAIEGSWNPLNIESLVAAASYAPLTGRWTGVKGDGIVPVELAVLPEPAESVIIEKDSITGANIHHLHVIPTPWNLINGTAPSIALENFSSYVSPGVVSQWLPYLYSAVMSAKTK